MVAEMLTVTVPNVASVLVENAPRSSTGGPRLFIYGRQTVVRHGHEAAGGAQDPIVGVVTVMCDAVGEGLLLVTCHPTRMARWLTAIRHVEPEAGLNVVTDAGAWSVG